MGIDLSQYTYENFLKTGKIIKEYYDGETSIVICSNNIQQLQEKEKKILIDYETRKAQINFDLYKNE